jgi:hypothetical protein
MPCCLICLIPLSGGPCAMSQRPGRYCGVVVPSTAPPGLYSVPRLHLSRRCDNALRLPPIRFCLYAFHPPHHSCQLSSASASIFLLTAEDYPTRLGSSSAHRRTPHHPPRQPSVYCSMPRLDPGPPSSSPTNSLTRRPVNLPWCFIPSVTSCDCHIRLPT